MLLVLFAGRKDVARDPRLTLMLLAVLAIFPLAALLLPKLQILPASEIESSTSGSSRVFVFLTTIWATGFILSMAKLAFAALGLFRWRKCSKLIESIEGIELRELDDLASPVAAGIFKPVIFVPEYWSTLPSENRNIILAHEIAHHRRRDPLWRLLVELVRALHWYHPGVHWMARRFAIQSECACDELVLRKGISAKSYAGVLCDFAQTRSSSPLALAMADRSSLERRVMRIASPPKCYAKLPLAIAAMLGVIAATGLCMIERKASVVSAEEVQLRLTANPFPGEP